MTSVTHSNDEKSSKPERLLSILKSRRVLAIAASILAILVSSRALYNAWFPRNDTPPVPGATTPPHHLPPFDKFDNHIFHDPQTGATLHLSRTCSFMKCHGEAWWLHWSETQEIELICYSTKSKAGLLAKVGAPPGDPNTNVIHCVALGKSYSFEACK